MYCLKCGSELVENETVCVACGYNNSVAGGVREEVPVRSGVAQSQAKRVSWEYARTTVRSDLAQVATDCYESLGYELTSQKNDSVRKHTSLSFRRERKAQGKAQLAKIQRSMDDLLESIANLEDEKTKKASIQALCVGIVSALILGVGMALVTVWQEFMVPGIVIGVVGILGCLAAFVLYRRTVESSSKQVAPRIDAAYDSLATACEEAQAVRGL